MKKIISTIFTLAMITVMIVPVSATTTDVTQGSNTGNTEVTAVATLPDANYTVTIPTTVAFGNVQRTDDTAIITEDLPVSLTSESNLFEKQINIAVTSNFKLKSTNHEFIYEMYDASSEKITGTNQAAFATLTKIDTTKTGSVKMDKKDIPAAGTYSNTVTFTLSVSNPIVQD